MQGRVMPDDPEKLQVFPQDWSEELVEIKKMYQHLKYYFPDTKVVSIAGILTSPSKYEFYPKNSGRINREFTQVTPDGNTYCYQSEDVEKFQNSRPTGKIVVQMTGDETLKIEHQQGSCTGSETLSNPEVYRR